jgi:hypothetical protein
MLTPEQTQKALDHLGEIDAICPLCKKTKWTVTTRIFRMLSYHKGDASEFPVLPIVCDHCGDVIFLNAIAIGLIEPSKEP